MREIKFRGKRLDNGEWVEGCNYLYDPDLEKVWIGGYNYSATEEGPQREEYRCEVEQRTVCQYTGQLDEYAVEIFEGDIVKLEDDDENYYIVSWEDDAAQYVLDGEEESLAFDYVSCAVVVVGNIFDNPDMADW